MKLRPFFILAGFFGGVLLIAQASQAAYESPSVSEVDLPYTVQTKTLLQHWFNNKSVMGAQIIALKDGKGKQFSGNYLDVGELGGIKKGDVFAVYTPKGDPVGFLKIVETQHYTSSFDFLELTVAPSERLITKKVSDELRKRIPESLKYLPGTGHKAKETMMAGKMGTQPAAPSPGAPVVQGLPQLPGAEPAASAPAPPALSPAPPADQGAPGLPPLPGGTAAPDTGGLPPLPGGGATPDAGGLPPLPGGGAAAPDAGGLPPLPGGGATPDAGGLPPLPGGGAAAPDAGGLPPLPGGDSGSQVPAAPVTGLPPLPDAGGAGAPPPADLPPLP